MRKFVSTAIVATALTAPALAQTVITGGSSGSTTFQVTATVDDACVLSTPSDFTLSTTLYWTNSAPIFVPSAASFTVACNVNSVYSVSVSPTITLTGPGSSSINASASIGSPDGAASTVAIAAFAVSGQNTGAANPGGQIYTVDLTFDAPGQDDSQGTYTGPATITLNLD